METIKLLKKENEKLREKIFKLLNTYMSNKRDSTYILINELINNELKQEDLCNK